MEVIMADEKSKSLSDEATMYEIVEVEEGEFALVRVDGLGDPLVTITFSEASLEYLRGAKTDVAKVMIEAGLDVVAELTEEPEFEEDPVLH